MRNERDGSVYIEVEGHEPGLEEFLEWCRHGPPQASVAECIVNQIPVKKFNDFEIRR